VLGNSEYIGRGLAALDFIANRLTTREGRLLRTCAAGSQPKLPGYLDDYAYLLEAMIALYEASWMGPCLQRALRLADTMIDQFWDPAEGGFFYTGRDHETLITRTKDQHDSSTPSSNGVAATALLRLAALTDRNDLRDKAVKTLELLRGVMESTPMAAGQLLIGFDFHLGPEKEVVIVGNPRGTDTRQVLAALHGKFRPHHVLATRAIVEEPGWDRSVEETLPLLKDKTASNEVTTYLCSNGTCQAPLIGTEAAVVALAAD
jgi:uncharacterized protein YyaL (SSP411 family)